MLLEVNNEDLEVKKIIQKTCGKEYSLLKRIRYNNYGSNRYKLVSLSPTKFNIDVENYNDNIYLNFDLRDQGIVFYFRYKNTEFVNFCKYHIITFQSNDYSFILQTDSNIYKFNILNIKRHNAFIKKLYHFKNKSQSNETSLE